MRVLSHVYPLLSPYSVGTWLLAACLLSGCSSNNGDDNTNTVGDTPSTTVEVEGSVSWLNDGTRDIGYTVNAIPFTVLSDSTVTIDVLSAGAYTPAMDSQIYLAPDDGSIESLDLIYTNDDGEAGSDGSTLELDSFLRVDLAAGNYVAYISGCCFSAEDALKGYHLLVEDEPTEALTPGEINGKYRITVSGDVEL
jgi:hypothetical protein